MCLFQQHINPNTTSTADVDRPSERQSSKPDYADEPSYVLHPEVGPYIKHRGISMVTTFGPVCLLYCISRAFWLDIVLQEIVFAGFDCRTDRTQKRICYPSTYDAIFKRLENQVVTGKTKHLLVLLGVPIGKHSFPLSITAG